MPQIDLEESRRTGGVLRKLHGKEQPPSRWIKCSTYAFIKVCNHLCNYVLLRLSIQSSKALSGQFLSFYVHSFIRHFSLRKCMFYHMLPLSSLRVQQQQSPALTKPSPSISPLV